MTLERKRYGVFADLEYRKFLHCCEAVRICELLFYQGIACRKSYTLHCRISECRVYELKIRDRLCEILVSVHSLGIEMVDRRHDLLGFSERRRHAPTIERVVADSDHAGMIFLDVVNILISIIETEAVANQFDIFRRAGQEFPPSLDTMTVSVVL